MKKILFLVAASALMVACGQKGQTSGAANGGDSAATAADSLVYEGQLPGGDGTFNTRLALAQDSTNGFSLTETSTKDSAAAAPKTGKFEAVPEQGRQGLQARHRSGRRALLPSEERQHPLARRRQHAHSRCFRHELRPQAEEISSFACGQRNSATAQATQNSLS